MGEFVVVAGVIGIVVLMIALLVGTLVLALVRSRNEPGDPHAVLAERYAKGEISEEEYTRRLTLLTYGPPIVLPPTLPPAQDES